MHPGFRRNLLLLSVVLACQAAPATAGTLARVSVATGGGEANGASMVAAISANGRVVGFASDASNLVADDRNGVTDVFVHDLATGSTERVSVSAGGAEANGASAGIALSADGRVAAFASAADNLVAGDTNGVSDVFVRDRARGTTERVSLASGGAQADGSSFGALAVSGDGRVVAFRSFATDLVAGDTNGVTDVFVRDRGRGTTERASVGARGQGDGPSFWPALSADGRLVAFASAAENLIADDANRVIDVFVRDRVAGTTERASVATGGAQGTAPSIGFPALSGDGRIVAFSSRARELVPGDANAVAAILVRDRVAGTTERASVSSAGAEADAGSLEAALSADGRFVVFYSAAAALAPGDANGDGFDVFLRDRTAASTERLTAGSAPSFVTGAAISADGGVVALFGAAPDLVPGDANGVSDVFVWRR